MSEQGWIDFLHAKDATDWVVLHGGATAVFRVGSLREATELAAAIAEVPDLETVSPLLTIGVDRLTVRLTRGVMQIEAKHLELARAVSAAARNHGVVADRGAAHEVQVAIAAHPGDTDVDFWRAVLGYDPRDEDNATDPLGHGSTVWMQPIDPSKPLRHAMHVDVSVARELAEGHVAAALAAGGTLVTDADAPEGWILADRAGNKVCIAAWPDGAMRADREAAGGS
jgi:4a-hydroxytetrahydrobiopterin dehydratase